MWLCKTVPYHAFQFNDKALISILIYLIKSLPLITLLQKTIMDTI